MLFHLVRPPVTYIDQTFRKAVFKQFKVLCPQWSVTQYKRCYSNFSRGSLSLSVATRRCHTQGTWKSVLENMCKCGRVSYDRIYNIQGSSLKLAQAIISETLKHMKKCLLYNFPHMKGHVHWMGHYQRFSIIVLQWVKRWRFSFFFLMESNVFL